LDICPGASEFLVTPLEVRWEIGGERRKEIGGKGMGRKGRE